MLLLFVLAHFGHHLLAALLTPLSTFIRDDFALNYTQVGWLLFAFNLSYGISQLPAGWLADRIGPRIVLTIGFAGVSLSGLLVGLSQTYITLILFLVLLGITGGGYHPAAAPLVSASVEPKNRGLVLGLHQIGGTLSFFLAPLIAVGIASALGWRGSFITIAIPAILFGIVFYVFLGRLGYTKKAKQGIPISDTEIPPTPGHLRRLVAFLILGIASMVLVYSSISFIPLYFVDHFGLSKRAAAVMLALVYFGGLWAGPLGGYLSDRLGKVPVMLAVGLIAGPVIYLLNLVPFDWGITLWGLPLEYYAVVIAIGMAMHLGMPVVEAYIISHSSERNRSTVLGIYYLGSRGGPAIAPAIGYLIDHYGFYTSFTIVGATLVAVTIVCAIFLWGSRD